MQRYKKTKVGLYAYKSGVKRGLKRYIARRKRRGIRYSLSNDMMRIKVEAYDYVLIPNGSSTSVFSQTAADFIKIEQIMALSSSWTSFVSLYGRYKIYGIHVDFSKMTGNAPVLSNGVPPLCAAFYPNLTASSAGSAPLTNDNKQYVSPIITVPQTKYWACPDGFFDGGAFGFGVWSQCSGYVGQVGQISIRDCITSTATGDSSIYNVKFTLYVLLSDKNL